MRKIQNTIISLLLTLILTLGLSATAFAADSSVTYEGGAEDFVFLPGSDYTGTDLFDGFKNVMPGDTLTEKITVENNYKGCDYVKIYLRAELHNEEVNPLSPKVKEAGETVATMTEFLKQLSMTVKTGDKVIYEASPNQLNGLQENVFLGSFHRGENVELTVELNVPIELGNEYSNRVGEVDWVFSVEEHNHSDDDDEQPAPSSPASPASPQTGDDTDVMLWAGLAGVSLLALILMSVCRRRKDDIS